MNNSDRTTIIAKGISLWADRQNLPGSRVPGSVEEKAWLAWADRYPDWVEFVKAEQFALFDRVNAKL